jgi:hypothetical protein
MPGHPHRALASCLAICLVACASRLPSVRPADLTITMTRGGGHAAEGKPVKETMIVSSGDESIYRIDYEGGGSIGITIDVKVKELDEIYEALRKAKFDQITTYESGTRHKGAIVTIGWQDGEITVRDTGKSYVSQGWKDEWDAVISVLKAFKKLKIEGSDIEIPPEFEPALIDNLELDKDEKDEE